MLFRSDNIETKNNDVKNELASEKIDKGKSILGVPSKLDKKEIKNPRAKKGDEAEKSPVSHITLAHSK